MKPTPVPVFALVLLGGCGGHDCTEIGCQQGATLELAAPLVEEGEYEFRLTTGTDTVTCTALVPMRRDGTDPSCEGMLINRQEITTRTDNGITGAAGDDIVSIWIGGDHDTLALVVTHDGSELLRVSVTPDYRGVEINGEGCGECPMATHTVGGCAVFTNVTPQPQYSSVTKSSAQGSRQVGI